MTADRKLQLRDLEHSLPMTLTRARDAVMERFRPILRRHRLSDQQWRVLRILAQSQPLAATELAQRAFVLSPSLSRILPHLEARGLIRRRSAAGDQRRAQLSLTPTGRSTFQRVARQIEDEYRAIDAAFDPQQLATLCAQLEELCARLLTTRRAAPRRE